MIIWKPDHAFDERLPYIDGVAEHDDVAAPDIFVRQQMPGNGSRRRVSQLVNQQMISDQQRVFHRAGGNHERLHQGRGTEKKQDDGDGPFSNNATRDIALTRFLGLLRSLLGYGGLLLTHDKTIVSEKKGVDCLEIVKA